MPFDGVLNSGHRQVGQVTRLVLSSPADVVEVLRTALASAGQDDQAALAAVAEDQALQIVIMDTLPRTGPPFGVEHPLHLVEQLLGDERLVPARVLLPVVGDEAQVVAVSQQFADLVHRYRPGGPPFGRFGA
nr:hypothetical protein [Parafrankia sp. BMG5.11]